MPTMPSRLDTIAHGQNPGSAPQDDVDRRGDQQEHEADRLGEPVDRERWQMAGGLAAEEVRRPPHEAGDQSEEGGHGHTLGGGDGPSRWLFGAARPGPAVAPHSLTE